MTEAKSTRIIEDDFTTILFSTDLEDKDKVSLSTTKEIVANMTSQSLQQLLHIGITIEHFFSCIKTHRGLNAKLIIRMEAKVKCILLLALLLFFSCARIERVNGAGECGSTSADTIAFQKAPCASASQDVNAAVSSSCCSAV
ncbi:hypothetical protein IEQ34_001556 [Dendrobium chrysotoxum]|uniref:Uncharacterized protein n=1 Tax=Dendrobium chrysotoxum TaxID=161865 RepID=A0AAV7HR59_DENCH|nr:hypothetical protein IEQ34_001556 [Dendrobium chrysotoxum]